MIASRWLKSRLLLLSWAIALGIGTLVAWQLLDSRAATWQRTQAANTNLLLTVSHVLERTLEGADRGLRHTAGVLENMAPVPGGVGEVSGAIRLIQDMDAEALFAGVSVNGYGIQLVLDDQGRVVAASRPPPPGDWVFLDRAYFKVHQQHEDAGFFMAPPFISNYDGLPSLAMSRRWNRPDGSFGGVVVQTMKLYALNDLFSSVELGPGSSIDVFLKDGSVVTRFPYTAEHIGASVAASEHFGRFARVGYGSFTAQGEDGRERLYVFRALERFPVLLSVAQASDGILEGWRRSATWLGGATLLLMCACVLLAVSAEARLRAHRRTTSRLRQAEHELRTVIDSLPVLVAYWDDQLLNRTANIAHLHWFGVSPEQLRGRHVSTLLDEERYGRARPHLESALAGEVQMFEMSMPDGQGVLRHTVSTYIPDWQQGEVKGVFVLVTDISERKAAETAMFEEKERFRIILESIKDGVITTDSTGCVLYLNPAAAAMTGWPLHEARDRPMEEVLCIETPEGCETAAYPLRAALEGRGAVPAKVEHLLVSRDGERVHIENSAAPILDEHGGLRGAVVVFHEVGQVRKMANRMTHLALHDALTGLPNRRRLDQVGGRLLSLAQAEAGRLAVLYLDLDGFKQVNDEYGHAVGDELLVTVTRRLSARLRASDGLYRQGGDEFVVLMATLATSQEAENLAIRLIECCRAPVGVSGRKLSVTVSVGISHYPEDAADLRALIQRADTAMYVAKNAGRNRYARYGGASVPGDGHVSVEHGESGLA